MKKKNDKKHRRNAESKYSAYYKRVNLPGDECAYCGDLSGCYDHAPPISKLENYNLKGYIEEGGLFLLYPSCMSCNSILGTFSPFSYDERLRFIVDALDFKVKGKEVWTDDEIEELEGGIRMYVEGQNNTIKDIIRRSNNAQNTLDRIFLDEIDINEIYGHQAVEFIED